jgi:hypothetical protein
LLADECQATFKQSPTNFRVGWSGHIR